MSDIYSFRLAGRIVYIYSFRLDSRNDSILKRVEAEAEAEKGCIIPYYTSTLSG